MENDKLNSALSHIREEIDAIDDQLIALLQARCAYVEQVGELKASSGLTGSFIRPKRESDMMKMVTSRFADSPFPAETAAHMWRLIIGASLSMESPINTAVHCPDRSLVPYFMSREYFGSIIPSAIFENAAQVIVACEENPHTVGVVNLQDTSSIPAWWLQVALSSQKLRIFTCVPFVQRLSGTAAKNPFLAIGQVEPEETGDDISYVTALFDYPHPESAPSLVAEWLKSGEFRGVLAASSETTEDSWAGLIKIQGYAAEGASLFFELQQHLTQISDGALSELRFIGSHATPVLLEEEE